MAEAAVDVEVLAIVSVGISRESLTIRDTILES